MLYSEALETVNEIKKDPQIDGFVEWYNELVEEY